MFWVRIGLGGREYLGVLDTGAIISIVAKNVSPRGDLKNIMPTAAICIGDGHVVHSCGDCKVDVPMGSGSSAHWFYVMDTEAFDSVLGSDLFAEHPRFHPARCKSPESPVERRTVRETGRVSDRVHTRTPPRRTQPRTDARGIRQGQPHRGPRAGTTRSEPSAPASAGASGRHNEPGSRPAFARPAQQPSKAGGASPRGGERHHGIGKASRSTDSNQTRQGAAHHAAPLGTPERHTAGHKQGTRTGAKRQRPPGSANPGSAHNTQRATAQ